MRSSVIRSRRGVGRRLAYPLAALLLLMLAVTTTTAAAAAAAVAVARTMPQLPAGSSSSLATASCLLMETIRQKQLKGRGG